MCRREEVSIQPRPWGVFHLLSILIPLAALRGESPRIRLYTAQRPSPAAPAHRGRALQPV